MNIISTRLECFLFYNLCFRIFLLNICHFKTFFSPLLRYRPINSRERSIHSNEVVKVVSDREVVVKQTLDNRMTKKFTFDRAFGPDSKQADVYQVVVAPLINEVLSGYNCTVFAYGQTGTGKTHTMIGDETPQSTSSYEDVSISLLLLFLCCVFLLLLSSHFYFVYLQRTFLFEFFFC